MNKLAKTLATGLALATPALAIAGGYRAGQGSVAFNDPYAPSSGTFTVSGNIALPNLATISDGAAVGTLLFSNASGLCLEWNGSTNQFCVATGGGTTNQPITFTGGGALSSSTVSEGNDGSNDYLVSVPSGKVGALQVAASSIAQWKSTGITFTGSAQPAAADAGIGNDGSNDLVIGAPAGKQISLKIAQNPGIVWDNTTLSDAGGFKPTSGATGAATLTNYLKQTYVISFSAFTAGVDQTSAQSMTGVAFGDACEVGTSADLSSCVGAMGVIVTSAGNIKIVVSPTSATTTCTPTASTTFTVSCLR